MKCFHVLVCLLAAGCLPPAGAEQFCLEDQDCGPSRECARTNECAPAGSLIAARISWTVRDQPATPQTCAPISRLRVTFEDFETSDNTTYEPVPCDLGTVYFNRMPPRFDGIHVAAFGPDDRLLSETRSPLTGMDSIIEVVLFP